MNKLKAAILITLSMIAFIVIQSTNASATPVVGFEAGNIIDEVVFTNKQSMTTSQIQAFLNSKVPVCDNWGTNGTTSTSRADWLAARGETLPLTCLKDYQENGKSSSQIIYDVAQTYNINPQVLIVLLQKEQALVTDDWPASWQYKSATGYGCPDTSLCSSLYYGFTNQVTWAARTFRGFMNGSYPWASYVVGNNSIYYNPGPCVTWDEYGTCTKRNPDACGSSIVNIKNRATQALYSYTPYQPNIAALNAGYGSGDSCSAYGNRNFYLYFTDWFNSVRAFVLLKTPRWMETKTDVKKIVLSTMEEIGDTLVAGMQLRFTTKTYINNKWYLRTASDTENDQYTVIALENIKEIEYTPLATKTYLEVIENNIKKITPNTEKLGIATKLANGSILRFDDEITVNGITYYRSAFDSERNINSAIPILSLKKITPLSFENPRYLEIKEDTKKIYIDTMTPSTETVVAGTILHFTNKVFIDGNTYYITADDAISETPLALLGTNTAPVTAVELEGGTRWMELNQDAQKHSMYTTEPIGGAFTSGRQIRIADIFTINDLTYYRTEFDRNNNNLAAIPSNLIKEIEYIAMDNPRYLTLNKPLAKVNPLTENEITRILPKGMKIYFSAKIIVDGTTYLRSEFDTINNNNYAIKLSDLNNL